MITNGITCARICVKTLLVRCSVKTNAFWSRSILESVTRPSAMNVVVFPLGDSIGSLKSPVITFQPGPTDGSGRMIPALIMSFSASSITS